VCVCVCVHACGGRFRK